MVRKSLAVLFLFSLLIPAVPAAAAEEEWEFDGGGWGHGVGLSLYGTLGQALDGRDSDQILTHYYTGAYVVEWEPEGHWTSLPNAIRVSLVKKATSVTLSAVGGPITICQPIESCPPPGPYAPTSFTDVTIDPGETWKYELNANDTTQCRFRKISPEPIGNLGWNACMATLTKSDSVSERFVVNGREYARGQILFQESDAVFHVVAAVSVDEYLYGLDAFPSSWPREALRALAIVNRSMVIAKAAQYGTPTGDVNDPLYCGCHIAGSYVGWSKEDPANGGTPWVSAVDDTEGDILIHPRSYYHVFDIAMPEFDWSNGGASEEASFTWGTEPGRDPWLQSVDDPWSADPSVNPDARWTVVVPASKALNYLGWDVLTNVEVVAGPPGAIVLFTGRSGDKIVSRTLSGMILRRFLEDNSYRRDGQPVHVSPYVLGVRARNPFEDIDGSVFENAIIWMAREKITVGCNPPANTRYCPNDHLTRGEMAVFLTRLLALPTPSGDHFADDEGKFYESAANRLYEAGITFGCGPRRYCGERTIPREQVAAFLARTLNLPLSSNDHFVDDEDSMFEQAINKLADAGITAGCNPPVNNKYCPQDPLTRGQMAAFLKRASEY